MAAHALDTGELCHAVAIGYDWCYDYLQQQQPATRAAIAAGLVSRGVSSFWGAFKSHDQPFWVSGSGSNWVVVTSSGAGIAALALMGEPEAPSYLPAFLSSALGNVRSALPGFAPDGAWQEGSMYHG